MQTAVDLAVEADLTEIATYLNEHIAVRYFLQEFTNGLMFFVIQAKKAKLDSSLWNLSDLVHRQLYEATSKLEIDIVNELLSRGADPCWSNSKKGEGGKTAIHVAAESGNVSLLSLLLSKQGNIRATVRDSFGETPLHKAAAEGRLEVCKYLIGELGVDPKLRNATLQTACDLAIENDQPTVSEYLSSLNVKA
jgi:ankyrin repeat protein